MVLGNKSPVGDDTGNLEARGLRGARTGDQVLDTGCVEELDVGEREHLGEQGRGEEGGMLDDDEVWVAGILLIRDTQVIEEAVGRLSEDHGREELATKPGTTSFSSVSWSSIRVICNTAAYQERQRLRSKQS